MRHAILALVLLLTPLAARAETADPAAAVGAYNDGIVRIMKADAAKPARVERFEALLRAHYDMAAITALVVGPKWAAASAAERDAAVAALTHHSAIALASNFAGYNGERFSVDPKVIERGTGRVVRVTIASPGHSDTLLYRLAPASGGWKIVDVIAEGVSQAAVQRAEFARTVAAGGVAELTRRLAEIDAAKTAQR